MNHIFISALFIISRVIADNPVTPPPPTTIAPASLSSSNNPTAIAPASTTGTGTSTTPGTTPGTPPVTNPGTGTTPPTTTTPPNFTLKPISARCNVMYVPISARDMAEITAAQNNTQPAQQDFSKLSDERNTTFCQQDELATMCTTASCTKTSPICKNCVTYTINEAGTGGTLGTKVIESQTCSGYTFNKTAEQQFVCMTDTDQLSCKSCTGQIDCSDCYDLNAIPDV